MWPFDDGSKVIAHHIDGKVTTAVAETEIHDLESEAQDPATQNLFTKLRMTITILTGLDISKIQALLPKDIEEHLRLPSKFFGKSGDSMPLRLHLDINLGKDARFHKACLHDDREINAIIRAILFDSKFSGRWVGLSLVMPTHGLFIELLDYLDENGDPQPFFDSLKTLNLFATNLYPILPEPDITVLLGRLGIAVPGVCWNLGRTDGKQSPSDSIGQIISMGLRNTAALDRNTGPGG